jgi:predicted phosphate transport protein (TIGR00153 family)
MQLKVGKDNSFYLLLENQADVAHKSAKAFKQACSDFENIARHTEILAQLELDGDDFTHRLQNQVASSFITPLDKEDLRELSQTLDDITDSIEAIVARVKIYRLSEARKDLLPMGELMVRVTEVVHSAVHELKTGFHSESLQQKLKQIHQLENESDALYRDALETLFFVNGIAPLEVIKWKEIYDRIEIAMDYCEDIAKIIGTFTAKYS